MYKRQDEIISRLHPDYVVHGDNWKNGPMQVIRKNVEKLLNEYGGKIIDLPYTLNENTIRDEKRSVSYTHLYCT